jgi:penicillin-binding protein 1A
VLAEFAPATPERALSAVDDYTLLSVMREVVNRANGSTIRSRFGIRADVAGKTGTTQDNDDGWFILMHPELVEGAWVGFNDSRVTLRSDYWGQGAHSALPMVGEFFSRALRARIVDPNDKFEAPETSHWYDGWFNGTRDWFAGLFASKPAPATKPAPKREAPPPADTSASSAVES